MRPYLMRARTVGAAMLWGATLLAAPCFAQPAATSQAPGMTGPGTSKSSTVSGANYTLPFNFTLTTCGNQPVNFSGRLHLVAAYRRDPQGGLHYRLDIVPEHFMARGVKNGRVYRVIPNVQASLGQGAAGNPAFVATFAFRLVSRTPGDNLFVHARAIVTTDANGAPMLSIVNPEVQCR